MGIRIHDLEPADGSNKRGKRKARGIGGKGGGHSVPQHSRRV